MSDNKIIRFSDFNLTNEEIYKANEEGVLEKQDYELYKDVHSEKYAEYEGSDKTNKLFTSEEVWVLKHKDIKIAVFDSSIGEEQIKKMVELLKNVE